MQKLIISAGRHRIFLFLALLAAGLAANYFRFPIFLDIDFLFGSIFAMLALQFFGPARGILATAIISSNTVILWNHPYAIIIMTAEVSAVAWLMTRRRMGMVLADTVFWLVAGMPLVFLFYHLVMHVSLSSTTITMTKQAINGIADALIARLLFMGLTLGFRTSPTSLRDIVSCLFSFFILCPTLIMLAVQSRNDFNETDHSIRTTLLQSIENADHRLDSWITGRKRAILYLAETAAAQSPTQMQPRLEQAVKTDSNNFLQIGLVDKDATISAYSPPVDETGQNPVGKSFADRPFIPQLKYTQKPLLSEVVMGGIGHSRPVVEMLAPVIVQGEYHGFVTGILTLDEIRGKLDEMFSQSSMLYTLVDKNGNVIMSNRQGQRIMAPFVREKGTFIHFDATISQWVPVMPRNVSIAERWRTSFYVAETTVGDLAEWKLILDLPVAPFQKMLYDRYTDRLTLLFFILLCGLALAELLCHRLIAALEQLCLITHRLPLRLSSGGQSIPWPESSIKATSDLIINFKEMADSLAAQFDETRKIKASLEQRIGERTVTLKESMERYRSILNASPDDITITDLQGRILMVSPAGVAMFGYENEEAGQGRPVSEFIAPEDRERAMAAINPAGTVIATGPQEYRGLRRDGSTFDIEVNRDFIRSLEGQPTGIVFIVRDISNRKRIEAENARLEGLNRQLQKNESLNRMAGAIAHNFNNILAAVIGNLDLVIQDYPPEKWLFKHLNDAMTASLRAAEISSLMLTYLGQIPCTRTPLDLAAVCSQNLPLLQAAAPKNLVFALALPSPGPIINADLNQLLLVLNNMVFNAWEADHSHQCPIGISVRTVSVTDIPVENRFPVDWQPKVQTYACLAIQDAGCGISKENIDKLFDPFFSSKFTGRGLGLPVVLGIMKAHDGAVVVESEPGIETVFQVFFPCSAQSSETI